MAKKRISSTRSLMEGLSALSRNLWWAWHTNAQSIFRELSPQLWERTNHNASWVMADISEKELHARLGDAEFAGRVSAVLDEFDAYMSNTKTWAAANAKALKKPVAYFSAEFGLHESVRIYSGGLGILAGDHTKSASDLGVPFYGISLFYREGYFEQRISVDGWQQEQYLKIDMNRQPTELVVDAKGNPIVCSVQIGFSAVNFVARRLRVGRSNILLLDTNLPENEERYRSITAHVYGGDSTTRIAQEIVLGIGGVRMLRAMGITPSVYHMNEGHSAFLTLELLRENIAKGLHKEKAMKAVIDDCIFTTHTPVPAGHDRFSNDLMRFVFEHQVQQIGMSVDELIHFGKEHAENPNDIFCMTVLAMKMSRSANGVSELHGHVSREMWQHLYPKAKTVETVPIGHITNGIHVESWVSEKTNAFWTAKLGADWNKHFTEPKYWKKALDPKSISDEELWALRYNLRRQLIEFARHRLHEQHSRYGNGTAAYDTILDPNALTICFARRFATYKRAPLIFTHFEKILGVFNAMEKPVQVIFAGKAHPRDDEGKKFIQRIIEITKHPNLFGKVIFLENYDMNLARYLVSGADVWLNNPRRPLEASGTSGQKVSINGGMNCSIMDGWWREGYDGKNGWSIGGDEQPADAHVQDTQDSQFLYEVLSQQIIPEFYDRDANGIPRAWVKRMRQAISTLVPEYSTHRMVAEYVKKYYSK